jgi:membrane fusion protein, multidrug efflux system
LWNFPGEIPLHNALVWADQLHFRQAFAMMFFGKPGSRRRRGVIIGTLVIIGLIVVAARLLRHGGPATHAAPPAVPVTAAVATRQDVPQTINAVGTVQSIDSVNIVPRVMGTIEKIEFTPGQIVNKGQELFLIDPRPFQAALDQTQAQLQHDEAVLKEAQLDLQRYQTLEQQNSIAKQQAQDQEFVVEQDKGTVQLDQANVEAAQLNLQYAHITSPITGRAGQLMVDLGNLVGPQTGQSSAASGTAGTATSGQTTSSSPLVSIVQLEPIFVTFSVPQDQLDDIQRNQKAAALGVGVYTQDRKLIETGKLTLIDNQVSTSTGTVLLQGTFANTDLRLWPGEFVRTSLTVSILHGVVTVPAQAIMVGPSSSYVYVIDNDNKVRRVDVEPGQRQGGVTVVNKGLSGGEKIVTDGQYRLDNGTVVTIQQTTAPTLPQAEAQAD